jgi:hypothetical protein
MIEQMSIYPASLSLCMSANEKVVFGAGAWGNLVPSKNNQQCAFNTTNYRSLDIRIRWSVQPNSSMVEFTGSNPGPAEASETFERQSRGAVKDGDCRCRKIHTVRRPGRAYLCVINHMALLWRVRRRQVLRHLMMARGLESPWGGGRGDMGDIGRDMQDKGDIGRHRERRET